uniref:Uncharacterized protein n=2 Tax=Spongospora subterranea TaxID=70186 RepID=A0A0H5R6W8_9EUKA|eukprot:CRZ09497.1 hypothetical protein [Spongospora subterranea]
MKFASKTKISRCVLLIRDSFMLATFTTLLVSINILCVSSSPLSLSTLINEAHILAERAYWRLFAGLLLIPSVFYVIGSLLTADAIIYFSSIFQSGFLLLQLCLAGLLAILGSSTRNQFFWFFLLTSKEKIAFEHNNACNNGATSCSDLLFSSVLSSHQHVVARAGAVLGLTQLFAIAAGFFVSRRLRSSRLRGYAREQRFGPASYTGNKLCF